LAAYSVLNTLCLCRLFMIFLGMSGFESQRDFRDKRARY
jgi:hypothetical protein